VPIISPLETGDFEMNKEPAINREKELQDAENAVSDEQLAEVHGGSLITGLNLSLFPSIAGLIRTVTPYTGTL